MNITQQLLAEKIEQSWQQQPVQFPVWIPTHYCPECQTKYKLAQTDIDEGEGFVYCDYHDVALVKIE